MHYQADWLHISNWSESMVLVAYGGAALALASLLRARTSSHNSSPESPAAPSNGVVPHVITPALQED